MVGGDFQGGDRVEGLAFELMHRSGDGARRDLRMFRVDSVELSTAFAWALGVDGFAEDVMPEAAVAVSIQGQHARWRACMLTKPTGVTSASHMSRCAVRQLVTLGAPCIWDNSRHSRSIFSLLRGAHDSHISPLQGQHA